MTTRDDDKFRSDFGSEESTDEVIKFLNGEVRVDKVIAENKKEEELGEQNEEIEWRDYQRLTPEYDPMDFIPKESRGKPSPLMVDPITGKKFRYRKMGEK